MANQDGISRKLAAFASNLAIGDMPEGAKRQVMASLADQIGVIMAAGRLGGDSLAFVDMARAMGGAGATLLGHREKVAPVFAAMANGALAHALDFEDTHDATLVHPSASVVPAVLAVAEARGAKGAEVMAALCAGTEVACRIAQGFVGNPQEDNDFYVLPHIGAFGAAVGAGRILGLDAAQMEQAMALAMAQVVNSVGVLTDPASSIRETRDGFNAKAGVIAAELALRGVHGMGAPLEAAQGYYTLFGKGRMNAEAFDGLGTYFESESLSYKPWPACRGTHVFIEIGLALMAEHGFGGRDIARIDVDVSPFFATLCTPEDLRRRPPNAASAKFSIPYTLGVLFAQGAVGLTSFDDETRADPLVRNLVMQVHHRVSAGVQADATSGALTVHLHDGRCFSGQRKVAPGHPSQPLTAAQLDEKFMTCAALAPVPLGSEAAGRVLEAIRNLDRLDNVARDLLGIL